MTTREKILRDVAEKCLASCIDDPSHGNMAALSTRIAQRLAKAIIEADKVRAEEEKVK